MQDYVALIEEAEKQIQDLRTKLEGSEEACVQLKLKLVEAEKCTSEMKQQLELFEQGVLLESRDKVDKLKLGVCSLVLHVNECAEKVGESEIIQIPVQNPPKCTDCDSQELTEIEVRYATVFKEPNVSSCDSDNMVGSCFKICKSNGGLPSELEYVESGRTCECVCKTHLTVLLLRNELEVALESLKLAKSQMVNLLEKHEEVQNSLKHSQENMHYFSSEVLALQAEIRSSEDQADLKIRELAHKLQRIEGKAKEVQTCWHQQKEAFELEVGDAKEVAAQRTAEASILLAKFEEAQETMKEADATVNALVKAREASKLEVERLRTIDAKLTNERDLLRDEVEDLIVLNKQKDHQYKNLEMELCSGLSELNALVRSLENAFVEVRDASNDELKLMLYDVHLLKSQIQQSTNLTRSWLEDIWSEIISKDCAVSVLHLCHMGVLLEAVTGLNAENGLLSHGLSASNSIIAGLREHNSKAKKELQVCKILKGKLLVDIKNSFDRILRKEDETGKISAKLNSFEKKILDLQLQEETMLARSKSMGFELSLLIKQINSCHKDTFAAISDQEKLLKAKEERVESQVEVMAEDVIAKDFESLIFESELKQMVLHKDNLELQQEMFFAFLANIQEKLVFSMIEAEIEKLVTSDIDMEVALLKKLVEEVDIDRSSLSEKLKQCNSRLEELIQVNKGLKCDIQSLKEVACSNNKLKGELLDIVETREKLMAEVQVYKTEMEKLTREWGIKENEWGASICRLQEEMERKDMELNKMQSMKEENDTLKNELTNLKTDYSQVFDDLQTKSSESARSLNCMNALGQENQKLQEKVHSLETCLANLHADCDIKSKEVVELQHSQSVLAREIILKSQDLEVQTTTANSLKEENNCLKRKHLPRPK
ncbi:hypothetical protein Syun_015544 [Stephania yunnanensis]|uniref:Uncharacterized protein n=1 Tax=Stephania yunnanensis TaxID=152371 RepID=A0AAP0JLQ9_9MAGN